MINEERDTRPDDGDLRPCSHNPMKPAPRGDEDADLDDEALDLLLSRLSEHESEDYERPAEDAILAYLDGTATAAQRAAVRRACLQSTAFILELADLAEDLDNLNLSDNLEELDAWKPPPAPSWEAFEAGHGQKLRTSRLPEAGRRAARHVVEMIRSAFSPLTAGHFVPVVLRSADFSRSVDLLGAAGILSSPDALRSRDMLRLADRRRRGSALPTAEEAAIHCFMNRVSWIDGNILVADPAYCRDPLSAEAPTSPFKVEVRDRASKPWLTAWFDLPADAREPRVWSLTIPSLDLRGSPEGEPPNEVVWGDVGEEEACLALTYRIDEGFCAVQPARRESR